MIVLEGGVGQDGLWASRWTDRDGQTVEGEGREGTRARLDGHPLQTA